MKELRLSKQIKWSEIAEKLNITYAAIGNYENGKHEPKINDLILLADFFEVSIDYLVGRENKY